MHHPQGPTVLSLQSVSGNAGEHTLPLCLLGNAGHTAASVDMLLFAIHAWKATNYILLFLLSGSSLLDCALVPSIGKPLASSLIEVVSGANGLLVNEVKCENRGLARKRL